MKRQLTLSPLPYNFLLPPSLSQVLGRNLEAVVNRSMELIKKWGDTYVSVEHLVSAGGSRSHEQLGRLLERLPRRTHDPCACRDLMLPFYPFQVLALTEDPRFVESLFKSEGLTKDALEQVRSAFLMPCFLLACLVLTTSSPPYPACNPQAIKDVRGSNKVTDQDPEGKYEALDKYARDLTQVGRGS